MITVVKVKNRGLLSDAVGVGGDLETCKVHLFKTGPALTGDSIYADYTECDFSGYASAAVTWGTVFTNDNGDAQVNSNLLQFQQTATTIANTVLGWLLTVNDAVSAELVAGEFFETPIPMAQIGDAILLTAPFGLAANPPVSGVLVD